MAQHERILWLTVLHRGLQDAANGRDPAWLQSRNFARVCHLAGVDPVATEEAFHKRRGKLKSRINRPRKAA